MEKKQERKQENGPRRNTAGLRLSTTSSTPGSWSTPTIYMQRKIKKEINPTLRQLQAEDQEKVDQRQEIISFPS